MKLHSYPWREPKPGRGVVVLSLTGMGLMLGAASAAPSASPQAGDGRNAPTSTRVSRHPAVTGRPLPTSQPRSDAAGADPADVGVPSAARAVACSAILAGRSPAQAAEQLAASGVSRGTARQWVDALIVTGTCQRAVLPAPRG